MTPDTWTYSDLYSAVQKALAGTGQYLWIVDLKPIGSKVVYGDGGRTFEAPYQVDAAGTVTIGDAAEVRSQTVYWPADQVAFSDAPDGTGRVTWKGLIFRGGRYPERPIREITEDDVKAIAASVPPEGIPICIDHNENSFLAPALDQDGARLVRAWAVGDELHGEVEVPGWFASATRNLWKSVSVGLDATLRAIRELSFVSNPRVADAAVFRANPAFNQFAQVHPDLAATLSPTTTSPAKPGKGKTMTFKDRLKGLWSKLTPEQKAEAGITEADIDNPAHFAAEPAGTPPAPTNPPTGDPALLARIAELERQTQEQAATFAAQQRANAALTFYEDQLRSGRATPAYRQAVIDEYEAAILADERMNFAEGDAQSYVKRLEDRYKAIQPRFAIGGARLPSSDPQKEPAFMGAFSDDDFKAAFGQEGK